MVSFDKDAETKSAKLNEATSDQGLTTTIATLSPTFGGAFQALRGSRLRRT